MNKVGSSQPDPLTDMLVVLNCITYGNHYVVRGGFLTNNGLDELQVTRIALFGQDVQVLLPMPPGQCMNGETKP